jgi:hypothetical protein
VLGRLAGEDSARRLCDILGFTPSRLQLP